MKIDLKIQKLDKKTTKVDANIAQKEIDVVEKNIIKELSKEKEIDGFNKGEAPEYVIRFTFKEEIENERNKVIFESISEQLQSDYDINIDDMEFLPEYDKIDDSSETFSVEFAITQSVFPTIDMTDYKTILPRFTVPTVSRVEVANELTRTIKSVVKAEPLDKDRKTLEKWDIAVVDIKTTINEETTESKNVMIEVGSGSSIPGFEDELIDMKVGYSKEINLTFPDDFANVSLAGQDVEYTVLLNEIRMLKMPKSITKSVLKKILPNDNEPTLELLEQRISDNMFFRKLETAITKEKIMFMDELIAKSSYDINDEFLDTEIQATFDTLSDEEKIRLEDNEEELATYKENIKTNIISWYKYRLALQELLVVEDVKLEDGELQDAFDDYIARNNFEDANTARIELEKDNAFITSLRDSTLEEKLFYKLFNLTK
ncbi:MAG: Trigger factor [uncultured Campylobacterales bacterium]|uniref:peptidylprolyl isomerase n=1 Tax=uncultured Campylobacterales bacterium TaxID=352960 RepID=A0A6S6TB79_9BACT|nr:MAG: Trigger factor [uncultured Campylobacterales bacterium]